MKFWFCKSTVDADTVPNFQIITFIYLQKIIFWSKSSLAYSSDTTERKILSNSPLRKKELIYSVNFTAERQSDLNCYLFPFHNIEI